MTDQQTHWEPSAIVVVPGVPGALTQPEGGQDIYPASTLPFVKILRSAEYPVQIADTDTIREISHHAADVWLPLVNFGIQVLAGGAGNVLADVLKHFFTTMRASRITTHIAWQVQGKDGSIHRFEFDGDSSAAIEAARTFERSLGYGDHE